MSVAIWRVFSCLVLYANFRILERQKSDWTWSWQIWVSRACGFFFRCSSHDHRWQLRMCKLFRETRLRVQGQSSRMGGRTWGRLRHRPHGWLSVLQRLPWCPCPHIEEFFEGRAKGVYLRPEKRRLFFHICGEMQRPRDRCWGRERTIHSDPQHTDPIGGPAWRQTLPSLFNLNLNAC